MDIREAYDSLEEDYDSVLFRIGRDELIAKYGREFTGEDYLNSLVLALSQKDWEEAYRISYSLMGVAMNLGFVRMADMCKKMTFLLKQGTDEEAINSSLKDISDEYLRIKNVFNQLG